MKTPLPQREKRDSKWKQVHQYIMDMIRSGSYQPGQTLPTLRSLAAEFDTSITPVVQAMRILEKEGLVELVRGHGCRVRNIAMNDNMVVVRPIVEVIGISAEPDLQRRSHTVAGLQLGILQVLGLTGDIKTHMTSISSISNPNSLDSILREIGTQRPDGLIIGPVAPYLEQQIAKLWQIKSSGTKVVLFASHHPLERFDRVTSDFVGGQKQLTEHLCKKGHKEFLRISFGLHAHFEQLKQEGFRQGLEASGFDPSLAKSSTIEITIGDETEEVRKERLERIIGALAVILKQRKISVIMAGNDAQAGEIRAALHILERHDIETTGYDGFWDELVGQIEERYGSHVLKEGPPVSVDTNLVECGNHMARLLLDRIKGELPNEAQNHLIPQDLIIPR